MNKNANEFLGNSNYPAISYGGYRHESREYQPSIEDIKEDLKQDIKENIKTLIIKKPLKLDCGQVINDYPLAYETYGSLNEKKDNAIFKENIQAEHLRGKK